MNENSPDHNTFQQSLKKVSSKTGDEIVTDCHILNNKADNCLWTNADSSPKNSTCIEGGARIEND